LGRAEGGEQVNGGLANNLPVGRRISKRPPAGSPPPRGHATGTQQGHAVFTCRGRQGAAGTDLFDPETEVADVV